MKHEEITEKIIQAFYKVYNTLGFGFLESVYLNALYIELKAIEVLVQENEQQLINYLKATNFEVGLLLNFGRKPQVKRKIFDNDKKPLLK